MSNQGAFRINEPQIIAEEIEGEAIILNFESGTYYSLNDSAMEIWRSLQAGYPCSAILVHLQKSYQDHGEKVTTDFETFLQQLREEELIVPTAPSATSATPPLVTEVMPYASPVLNKFTDLQNLLLLDPIHEVDEMGWPHPAP